MPHIEIAEALSCERCGGESYLMAQIPHPSYLYPNLQPKSGMITFQLCPQCDRENSHAHGLLAYFACYGVAGSDDSQGFATLVNEWITSLSVTRIVDPDLFDADVDAYRRGEFD